MPEDWKISPRRLARLTMRSMSLGSGAAAIASQTTGHSLGTPALKQRGRTHTTLDVMLERADTELLDLVCGRAGRLGERAVEPTSEHAAQQREPFRRDRTTTASRAGATHGAALGEIERDQLALSVGLAGLPAPGAGVEHRLEALEREQLPEERGRHERIAGLDQRAQCAREHPVQRRVGLVLLRDLVDGLEHRDRTRQQRVFLA